MKIYKVTLVIVDHDDTARDEIVSFLSSIEYDEHCLGHPVSITAIERDVGDITEDHPLFHDDGEVVEAEVARLFGNP